MNKTPTQLELLLVLGAGGTIRVPSDLLEREVRGSVEWLSWAEPNGDLVFKATRFETVDARSRPVDEFAGL